MVQLVVAVEEEAEWVVVVVVVVAVGVNVLSVVLVMTAVWWWRRRVGAVKVLQGAVEGVVLAEGGEGKRGWQWGGSG